MTIKGWQGRSGSRAKRKEPRKKKETLGLQIVVIHIHTLSLTHVPFRSHREPGEGGEGQIDAITKARQERRSAPIISSFFILNMPPVVIGVLVVRAVRALAQLHSRTECFPSFDDPPSRPGGCTYVSCFHMVWCLLQIARLAGWCFAGRYLGHPLLPCTMLIA